MLNAPRKANIGSNRVKTIILTGGLNEELSNLELNGGELTAVTNYVEKDGAVNGYTSFEGYERYDGQTSPASVDVTMEPSTGEVTDDTAREAARTAILPIPGSGITTGVHVYDNDVYGFRDNAGATAAEMYKGTSGGWSKITSGTMAAGGSIKAITVRFANYNTNNLAMFWVDSVSDIHVYNGTTVSTITHASLPSSKPTHIGYWNNRLFVAYPKGGLFFSRVGDPTDFSAVVGAGEVLCGDDITNIVEAPGGALIVTTRSSIQIINDQTVTSSFAFTKEYWSKESGAIDSTALRMLGHVYFADDRGVTNLEAVDAFGDFKANSIAKRVEKTYQGSKQLISTAIAHRQDNQYILFFNGPNYAEGLVFSFKGKRLKGATKIRLDHRVYNATSNKDTNFNDRSYFGSDDGYVFELFTGTSFDGEDIETNLATSFYPYGSPTCWKHFKEIMVEVSGESFTSVSFRNDFDYREPYMAATQLDCDAIAPLGGIWGTSEWGAFFWGGTSVDRLKDKIIGYGTNMRLQVLTKSKYKTPHSLHNMTIQYTLGATRT